MKKVLVVVILALFGISLRAADTLPAQTRTQTLNSGIS